MMAKVKEHSFDITAEVDKQELKNSIELSKKEIASRYDFKGTDAQIDYLEKEKLITQIAPGDLKIDAMRDIVISKAIRREIPASAINEIKREKAGGSNIKAILQINDSIGQDEAKKIVKEIKNSKLKVQASIRGDEVRVSGKSKDDLQQCMQLVKELNLNLPLRFTNFL
jgi:uncharacterized protein YajQ (UPF0234 family)